MNQLYNEVIEYDSINTLFLKNFIHPPHRFDIFYDEMKKEFQKNNEFFQKKLKQKSKEKRKNITISFYRINEIVDYGELSKKYESLLKDIKT